ncbi:MAG: glutathione S-transferase N-terminal domain-containing protein [Actinomycetota bacterium]
MITLHDYVLSANCYKVRLLLSLLDLDHETVAVDFHPGREHKGAAFRELNPMGHIPVLVDDGFVMRDAHAILVYLAARYDATGTWYPADDAQRLGETAQWMAFADATASTLSAARLVINLGYDLDLEAARRGGHEVLRVLDEHLWFRERAGHEWLVPGVSPTLGDLAVFPDVVLAEEGGVELLDYPAVRRWLDRVKQWPRFALMPGVFPFGTS